MITLDSFKSLGSLCCLCCHRDFPLRGVEYTGCSEGAVARVPLGNRPIFNPHNLLLGFQKTQGVIRVFYFTHLSNYKSPKGQNTFGKKKK